MTNQTAMQYFEWYLPSDGQHWNNLAEDAQHLADLGISHVWMPPAFKATNKDDVGYGVYDLFDLGEFDQKGTVRTKYGLKEEYLNAINQLKEVGIVPMADVVLNHKAAADKLETFEVVEVDPEDRTQEISEPFEIEAGHTSPLTDAIKPTTILNGTGTTLTELTSMPNVIKVASILSKVTTKVGQTTTWLTMRMVTLTTLCMLT